MPTLEEMLDYIEPFARMVGLSAEEFIAKLGLDPANERQVEKLYRLMREHRREWVKFLLSIPTEMDREYVLGMMEEAVDWDAPETVLTFIRDITARLNIPEAYADIIIDHLEKLKGMRRELATYRAMVTRLQNKVKELQMELARRNGTIKRLTKELEELRRKLEERPVRVVRPGRPREELFPAVTPTIVIRGPAGEEIEFYQLPFFFEKMKVEPMLEYFRALDPELTRLLAYAYRLFKETGRLPMEVARVYIDPISYSLVELAPVIRGTELLGYRVKPLDYSTLKSRLRRLFREAVAPRRPRAPRVAEEEMRIYPAFQPLWEWARIARQLAPISPYLPKSARRMATSIQYWSEVCGIHSGMSEEEIVEILRNCVGINVPIDLVRHWKEKGYIPPPEEFKE